MPCYLSVDINKIKKMSFIHSFIVKLKTTSFSLMFPKGLELALKIRKTKQREILSNLHKDELLELFKILLLFLMILGGF